MKSLNGPPYDILTFLRFFDQKIYIIKYKMENNKVVCKILNLSEIVIELNNLDGLLIFQADILLDYEKYNKIKRVFKNFKTT